MLALARLRESLTLVLIALLPMHAMAMTVLTHVFEGAGHSPSALFSVWKEVMLAFIVLLAITEMFRLRDDISERRIWSLDLLDWCILGALTVAAFSSFTGDQAGFTLFPLSKEDKMFLFGFKYDFLPLITFFLLRRVPWSRDFRRSASLILIGIGILFAVFGLATLFLPMSFFTAIGYSDLHSLYRPHAPLAAFQMIEGTDLRRIQSVMSGPNQFGLWLLLPLAAVYQWMFMAIRGRHLRRAFFSMGTIILLLIALTYTYSRSAWVGAAVMTVAYALLLLRHRIASVLHRSIVISIAGVVSGIALVVAIQIAPNIFLRAQSLQGHLQKPLQAWELMQEHPFGMGLGSAGPANNHVSDTCVFFDLGADISWAKKRTDICVFVGGVRRLPAGKACNCPVLTENWYLQWGVEMGYIGFVLSILLVAVPLFYARRFPTFSVRMVGPLAFLGVAVGGLFLHSFEDAAVAYTIWILLASAVLHLPEIPFGDGDIGSGTLRA